MSSKSGEWKFKLWLVATVRVRWCHFKGNAIEMLHCLIFYCSQVKRQHYSFYSFSSLQENTTIKVTKSRKQRTQKGFRLDRMGRATLHIGVVDSSRFSPILHKQTNVIKNNCTVPLLGQNKKHVPFSLEAHVYFTCT